MNNSSAQRNVLLTGATGAVGSAVLGELLKDPTVRVYLVVRASSSDEARQRASGVLRFLGLNAEDASLWKDRLVVEAGDLTRSGMGMAPEAYQCWTREVNHVIHAAGNVKLNQTLEEATRDAVDSTRHILQFINQCGQHQVFQKLDHVSTVGVCGRWDGPVPEEPMSRPRQFRNTYETAKAEGEDLVWAAIQSGLPGTIHRPSMVVGNSVTGRIIHFQIFYHLLELMTGARTWGIVPDAGQVRLDIIPSDYVAKAITISNQQPAAIGRIFHLCSGPAHVVTGLDMSLRVRRIFQERGKTLPSLKKVSPARLRQSLPWIKPFVSPKLRKALIAAPFMLTYLDHVQTFVNEKTARYFSERGLPLPPLDTYLSRVVDYYLLHKKV